MRWDQAKNPCSALTKKHPEYLESVSSIPGAGKNNPSKFVFATLWTFAKVMVGGKAKEDTEDTGKSKAAASSEAPVAKRARAQQGEKTARKSH